MRRRSVLASFGTVLAGATAGCLTGSTPSEQAGDMQATTSTRTIPTGTWPQVGYDAQNSRHTTDPGPHEKPTTVWTAIGDRPVYPPVVDDALYLTRAWLDGTALALSADDGSVTWTNDQLPPMRWMPALHEDHLLVITREEGNVVRLHGLNTTTGEQAWVRERGITASSGGRPPTGPTVRDGTVYLGSSRGILACDATSGAIEWGATLDEHVVSKEGGPTWRTDWATPAVTADRAFTFDMNDGYGTTREVYAVDRTTGEQDWTAELDLGDGWSLQGHVVAGDGRVFVSALDPHTSLAGETEEGWSGSERLFALDAATGAVDWSWDLTGKTLTPPALADGTLYLGEWYPDADTGRLHALDVADGSVDWTYKTGVSAVRAVTVAANTIYIAAGEGVAAIDPVEGSRRWRIPTDAILSAPIVVGDRLYLHTNPGHNWDSRVIAMRASSG